MQVSFTQIIFNCFKAYSMPSSVNAYVTEIAFLEYIFPDGLIIFSDMKQENVRKTSILINSKENDYQNISYLLQILVCQISIQWIMRECVDVLFLNALLIFDY